ncbi:hypothetical protein NG799_28575 [Laspinema sp. D1]|uniref:Uncharacterized protein n=1 Tax=Laspinema palackyanum D2a TaxID=2953684 RepID=A0ABT2N2H6_9CYAN|nr:hypothetical protein [Laspinema sp. D2a]
MTTLTLSAPKCLGFFNQGLQDKLYPYLSNGERLTLDDAIRLIHLSSEGAWWSTQKGGNQGIGQLMANLEADSVDYVPFDGFDSDADEFRAVSLQLTEWLALARWSSELAECRVRDYERAKVAELAAQSPRNWEVK